MIVLLARDTTEQQLAELLGEMEAGGLETRLLNRSGRPMIHVLSGSTRRVRVLLRSDQVRALIPTSGPRILKHGRRFYPYHFINWSAACLVLLGGLILLSGYLPPGTGRVIDVENRPEVIELPWYGRAPATLLELLPAGWSGAGWAMMLVAVLVVFCLPLLDRTRGEGVARRIPILALGLALAAATLVLTLWGVVP
jgi:hypothetical protein